MDSQSFFERIEEGRLADLKERITDRSLSMQLSYTAGVLEALGQGNIAKDILELSDALLERWIAGQARVQVSADHPLEAELRRLADHGISRSDRPDTSADYACGFADGEKFGLRHAADLVREHFAREGE